MKPLPAALISLVAGQMFVTEAINGAGEYDIITVQPFTENDPFDFSPNQFQVKDCGKGICFLSEKPSTKKVYIGLKFGDDLVNLLPKDGGLKLAYYITPDDEKYVYDGIHIIKTHTRGDEALLEKLEALTDDPAIFPTKAHITLSYSTDKPFLQWIKKSMKKFNQVIISIQGDSLFTSDLKHILTGDNRDMFVIETSEAIAMSIDMEVKGLHYRIHTEVVGKTGQSFSNTVVVCRPSYISWN